MSGNGDWMSSQTISLVVKYMKCCYNEMKIKMVIMFGWMHNDHDTCT